MILKTLAAAATLAALTSGQAAAMDLPAPIPEFRSPQELQADAASRAAASQQSTAERAQIDTFYTGKPQDRESGTHLFLFRNYDPELSRWTASDPSGFPDGANNVLYVSNPLTQLDSLGLWSDADFVHHYLFGKSPYAKGADVDLGAVGNGAVIRSHTAARHSLWKPILDGYANNASYHKKTTFSASGSFVVNIDYQPVVFSLGNSNVTIDYVIDGSGSVGFHEIYNYTYFANLRFTIDDEFRDPIDIFDWFTAEMEVPGAMPYGMEYSWESVEGGHGSYE